MELVHEIDNAIRQMEPDQDLILVSIPHGSRGSRAIMHYLH